jgi:membrane-bound lytic murein transglycosylase D
MIKRFFFSLLLLGVVAQAVGQTVPKTMDFAGMKLRLTEDARQEIQADVDALTRSEKYFLLKLDKVNMYMPIIERVLQEEGMPDDFKYLVIQESGLVADAVSTSNAVGFWQFKVAAAEEVGMKINQQVDERMNIVSSTRGASKYLKINYSQFENWIYALLAYNTGRTGARDFVEEKYFGVSQMPIDKNTHWYVKKFLAHKVAFEPSIGTTKGPYSLLEYNEGANKSLAEIAREYGIQESLLAEYNVWLRRGRIPDDHIYTVIIPFEYAKPIPSDLIAQNPQFIKPANKSTPKKESEQSFQPQYTSQKLQLEKPMAVKVNGLKAVIAPLNYDERSLAAFGGITVEKFRSYNDLKGKDRIIAGEIYYYEPKKSKARVYYHTVAEGEALWDISQKYGLKMKKLMVKNRMRKPEALEPGRIMWLRHNRPGNVDIEYAKAPQLERPGGGNGILATEAAQAAADEAAPHQPLEEKPVMIAADTVISPVPPTPSVIELNEVEEKVKEIDTDSLKTITLPEAMLEEETETSTELKIPDNALNSDTNLNDDIVSEEVVVFVEEEPVVVEEPYKAVISYASDVHKSEEVYHLVLAGETLYGLSKKYNVQIDDIKNWNKALLVDGLKAGQRIIVGKAVAETVEKPLIPAKKEDAFQTYAAKPGDTLYKISRDFDVPLADLMKWNNKTDFELKEGEILKIKVKE